jgi:hypothetical protein
MKTCSNCKQSLTLSNFQKNKWKKDGLSHYCKSCKHEIDRQYSISHREQIIEKLKKWRAKISYKSFDYLYQLQKGQCAICSTSTKKLAIDHNHTTGDVRGLLCHPCNTGIGFLKEDKNTFVRALQYLDL